MSFMHYSPQHLGTPLRNIRWSATMWLSCLEYAVVPHTVCCAISMKEEIAQTCCNDDILSQYYVPL